MSAPIRKIVRLMCVCYDDASTKSSIISATANASGIEQQLIFFDKSASGYVAPFLAQNGLADKAEVRRTSIEQNLVSTICSWGAAQEPDTSTWVQVLAEDDCFTALSEAPRLPTDDTVMLLCPMAYVYKLRLVFEDQTLAHGGLTAGKAMASFVPGDQPHADSSWHALIRLDVFSAYSRWVMSLPDQLWNISNACLWMALARGQVGVLNAFLFVKDAGRWQTLADTVNHLNGLYQRMFQLENGAAHDPAMYWLGVLAMLHEQRSANPDPKLEQGIAAACHSLVQRPSLRKPFSPAFLTFLRRDLAFYLLVRHVLPRIARHASAARLRRWNSILTPRAAARAVRRLPAGLNRLVDFYMNAILQARP